MAVQYQRQAPQQQQQRTTVKEIQRSPLSYIVAWTINKASGTVLEGPVKFLLGGSFVGRIASVVLVSLALGALTDLVIVSTPVLAKAGTIGTLITTTAVLGAVAGAGAGGLGGAIVGAIWGWFVGQVSDAIVTENVANQISNIFGPILTWITATVVGYLAGNLVTRIFERLSKNRPLIARFVVWVFSLVVIVAVGYAVFAIARSILF